MRASYVATINTPGYLPMDDDPPVFDTTREAWEYLYDEHERAVDQMEAWETDDGMRPDYGDTGTIWATTPGRDSDDPHDLGVVYSVTLVVEEDDN